MLRLEAYAEIGQYRDTCNGSLSGWLFFIQDRAITHNKRFQLPLENSRAVSTAKAVAVWTWEKYWNHSPELQSKRQARQVVKRREKNATRDQAIVQAIEGGRTYRDVAREFGLSLLSLI